MFLKKGLTLPDWILICNDICDCCPEWGADFGTGRIVNDFACHLYHPDFLCADVRSPFDTYDKAAYTDRYPCEQFHQRFPITERLLDKK